MLRRLRVPVRGAAGRGADPAVMGREREGGRRRQSEREGRKLGRDAHRRRRGRRKRKLPSFSGAQTRDNNNYYNSDSGLRSSEQSPLLQRRRRCGGRKEQLLLLCEMPAVRPPSRWSLRLQGLDQQRPARSWRGGARVRDELTGGRRPTHRAAGIDRPRAVVAWSACITE